MSLRKDTPCDLDGICPYESREYCSCEYWCGADEPQDYPEIDIFPDEDENLPADNEPDVDECGYNPYLGCYDFDC